MKYAYHIFNSKGIFYASREFATDKDFQDWNTQTDKPTFSTFGMMVYTENPVTAYEKAQSLYDAENKAKQKAIPEQPRKQNAKEVPLHDTTKALFDALERFDRIRVINAPINNETHDTMPEQPLLDNVSDNGEPHKYTNGRNAEPSLMTQGVELHKKILGPDTFKAGKDAGLPTRTPPEHPELVNFSTEKPSITLDDFLRQPPGTMICSGVAYYARAGYNRHGIGAPKRFVAVKTFESWAIYIGPILAPLEWLARDGDRVLTEAHIRQLVDCDETIYLCRF